ncbi:MAG: hypothetical protein D3904_08540 [Candidatus Electrothrix sp. EH2]|nr:hypothetical protein [Candidatus Electrothrix sp. EH2]
MKNRILLQHDFIPLTALIPPPPQKKTMREKFRHLIGILFFRILTSIAVCSGPSDSFASNGDTACKLYKPLTVAISAEFSDNSTRNGFGFIVGEQKTSQGSFFYIVTANHVVRKKVPGSGDPEISLRFFWDVGSPITDLKLLDISDSIFDLALLRVAANKIFQPEIFFWNGQSWCGKWRNEETVWFIGKERKWYVPSKRGAGSLLYTQPDPHGFIRIEIGSVLPGTSGAPLVTNEGIVGMVLRDTGNKDVRAVSIASIRRFVLDNRYPWNLTECGSNVGSSFLPRVEFVEKNNKNKRGAADRREKLFQKNKNISDEKEEPRLVSVSDELIVMTEKKHQSSSPVQQLRPTDINLGVPLRESEQKKVSKEWHFDDNAEMLLEPLTKMNFVRIPGGCFQMGAPESEKERFSNEGPPHKVCIDSFFIGKYEVTQGQWNKLMEKNPAGFKKGDNYPVERVSWEDTQNFIRRMNRISGLNFRLPTEAEWEYAVRAGTTTARYWGDDISCDKAMYENSLSSEGRCIDYVKQQRLTASSTAPVGSYPPNQFRLHDMLGNVYEWCSDWYSDKYDSLSSEKNPIGPSSGKFRVIRGGNWLSAARYVRSSSRYWYAPDKACPILGFRLVLPINE